MGNPNKNYLNRAMALKKAGLISYNLNEKLNSGQKSNITKKYNEYLHYFTDPESFTVRHVSNDLGKKLHDSGYKTVKGAKKTKLFLPNPHRGEVKIKSGKIKIIGARSTETIIPSKRGKLLDDLKQYENKKLKKGQFMTIKIGESNPINRKFDGTSKMLNYISAKNNQTPYEGQKIPGWHNDDAIRHISFVEIQFNYDKEGRIIKQAKKAKKKTRRN